MTRHLLVAFLVLPLLASCKNEKKDPAGGDKPGGGAASASAAPLTVVGKRIDIEASDKGFVPSSVTVTKGEATTLVFTRTSDDTCATAVVFPELKIEKPLPLKQPVAVPVPVEEAKTYAFQCGMGMFKSKLVVQ
jgi:plastocyanin domain-containing protein